MFRLLCISHVKATHHTQPSFGQMHNRRQSGFHSNKQPHLLHLKFCPWRRNRTSALRKLLNIMDLNFSFYKENSLFLCKFFAIDMKDDSNVLLKKALCPVGNETSLGAKMATNCHEFILKNFNASVGSPRKLITRLCSSSF